MSVKNVTKSPWYFFPAATPVKFANGTALLPSLTFSADLNTGIYRIGADNIGMALGGLKIVDFAAGAWGYYLGGANTTAYELAGYKARGTVDSPTVITSGDDLLRIAAYGYSGVGGYVKAVEMLFDSEGTIATTRVGGSWKLYTATDASPSVSTLRLTVDSAGLFTSAGRIVASGGVDGVVGAVTAAAGTFTTLAASGQVTFSAATASTSTTTGALVLSGASAGLGVAGAAFIGTNLSVAAKVGLQGAVSDRAGVAIGAIGSTTFTGAAASYETAGVHIRYAGLTAPAGSTGDIVNLYMAGSVHTVTDGTHAIGADIYVPGGTTKAGSGTITEGAGLYIGYPYIGATYNYAILATGLVKFVTALQIAGTNIVTANQFSAATQGAASTTMYIGNGAITVTSDVRVKSHIEEWGGDALALMRRINVVEYDMDDAHKPFGGVYDGKYVGLTAQNLYDVAPWTVNTQGGKDCWECRAGLKCEAHIPWQVKQDLLAGVYVRGFQQIDQRIHDLERELAVLKGQR